MTKEAAAALLQYIQFAITLGIPVQPAMWEQMQGAVRVVEGVAGGLLKCEVAPAGHSGDKSAGVL